MQQIEVVLAEAQAGDRAAYGRLVSRFQDMAVAYARSVLGDPHLAEERQSGSLRRSSRAPEQSPQCHHLSGMASSDRFQAL
jgi:hypothetical protein